MTYTLSRDGMEVTRELTPWVNAKQRDLLVARPFEGAQYPLEGGGDWVLEVPDDTANIPEALRKKSAGEGAVAKLDPKVVSDLWVVCNYALRQEP
jgi:hypothetical protein